jgi:hypothetical protein
LALLVKESSTQLSEAVGSVHDTAAEQSPALLLVLMSAGIPLMTGASESAPPPPHTPQTSTSAQEPSSMVAEAS